MRLDHFLRSPRMSDGVDDGGVDRWVRGEVNASDHAPVWITLDCRLKLRKSIGLPCLKEMS